MPASTLLAASIALMAANAAEAAPVGTGNALDPVLVGTWNITALNTPAVTSRVTIKTVDGVMRVSFSGPAGAPAIPEMSAWSGAGPSGATFLAIGAIGTAETGEPRYLLLRYQAEGQMIRMWPLDPIAMVDNDRSGGNATKVLVRGKHNDFSVRFRVGPEEAAAFLESPEGQSLFVTNEESWIFQKTAP